MVLEVDKMRLYYIQYPLGVRRHALDNTSVTPQSHASCQFVAIVLTAYEVAQFRSCYESSHFDKLDSIMLWFSHSNKLDSIMYLPYSYLPSFCDLPSTSTRVVLTMPAGFRSSSSNM